MQRLQPRSQTEWISAPPHENLQIIIKKDMKASSCLPVPPPAPASTEELKALSAPTVRWRPKPRGKTVQNQGGNLLLPPTTPLSGAVLIPP